MVTVKLPSAFKGLSDAPLMSTPCPENVRMLLDNLRISHPALMNQILEPDGTPIIELLIAINGISVDSLRGLETPLQDEDQIEMHLLLAGG